MIEFNVSVLLLIFNSVIFRSYAFVCYFAHTSHRQLQYDSNKNTHYKIIRHTHRFLSAKRVSASKDFDDIADEYEAQLQIESEENSGSGRRVLKLINNLNGSIEQNDFSVAIWQTVRYEATAISEGDMKAATLMANSILSQPSLEEAVIAYVANQLETPLFPATQIRNLFADVCKENPKLPSCWSLDMLSSVLRDSSQPNAVSVLLFNQGFHSLVTYRIANSLWYSGRDGLARYFQSLSSRTFGADIHPACRIGTSCVLASGTGVVIGETAVIGNACSISHGVTLGGTGKETGDRHPKIGDGVYIAAGATVLGNIRIGEGCIVDAGSVVTKPVEPFSRVSGVPAKVIAKFSMADLNGKSVQEWAEERVSVDGSGVQKVGVQDEKVTRHLFRKFKIDYQGDQGIGT